MEQSIEAAGTDVEAAIAEGLARLGVDRGDVEIKVLEEPTRRVWGLGSRDARVRLTVKAGATTETLTAPSFPSTGGVGEATPAEPDEAGLARSVLEELLALLGEGSARVTARRAEPAPGEKAPPWILDVAAPTDDLIGHRGETLAALQHITRLIVGREREGRVRLVIDVNGYKARRERSLRQLAHRLAEQAVDTERTVVLEPMPPNERRIVHLALRDHPRVTTESVGEGDRRKVTIIPRNR